MHDPYTQQHMATYRLVREWQAHDGIIIGVDFDDTIYDCHKKGFKFWNTVHLLQVAQSMGCTLCVWTANSNKQLVTDHWNLSVLTINYYNESPIVLHEGQVKPYFNLLLDDRAGLASALISLELTIKAIKGK